MDPNAQYPFTLTIDKICIRVPKSEENGYNLDLDVLTILY